MSCVYCHSLWISLIHDVAEGRKIIVALVAVHAVIYGDKPNIMVREIGVADMDKTTNKT